MATSRASAQMRPAFSCFLPLFCFILTVGTANKLALVEAGTPPSHLVVYVHQRLIPPNVTAVISVSPSAAKGGPPLGFGSIAVLNNVLREGAAEDSPVVGRTFGEAVFEIDLSIYLTNTYMITTPTYEGSISYQGVTSAGVGEVGITTGTGDFRWARGYAEITAVTSDILGDAAVFKTVFHIKYDCQ